MACCLLSCIGLYSEKKEVVKEQQKHFHLVHVLTAVQFAFPSLIPSAREGCGSVVH